MTVKKLLLAAAIIFVFSTMAFAAPLTNFKKGDVAIELGADMAHFTGQAGDDLPSDSNNGWGFCGVLTISPADRFALQYVYTGINSKKYEGRKLHLDSNEINLLYSANKYINVFAGYRNFHGKADLVGGGTSSTTTNIFQVGVGTRYDFCKKCAGYGRIAVGTKDSVIGEVGLSYLINDNFDLNLAYLYSQAEAENVITIKDSCLKLSVGYKFSLADRK